MAVDCCADCGVSLGTRMGGAERCVACERNRLTRHYLALLPEADEGEHERLGPLRRKFLASVREQFGRRGKLTEKQFLILGEIYESLR